MLGKVKYFWGGKSLVLGWDSRWGTPTKVTADDSPTTGTVRPFGLDCNGFVDWTFYNAYVLAVWIKHQIAGLRAAPVDPMVSEIPLDLIFLRGPITESRIGF